MHRGSHFVVLARPVADRLGGAADGGGGVRCLNQTITGNRQLAEGRLDVAFQSPRRLGVMTGAPFLLLHGEPFLSDHLEGVVGGSRIRCAAYPACRGRIIVFEQPGFDFAKLGPRSGE